MKIRKKAQKRVYSEVCLNNLSIEALAHLAHSCLYYSSKKQDYRLKSDCLNLYESIQEMALILNEVDFISFITIRSNLREMK